jgi:hypothetical protein
MRTKTLMQRIFFTAAGIRPEPTHNLKMVGIFGKSSSGMKVKQRDEGIVDRARSKGAGSGFFRPGIAGR